jgi:hypothetical protein
MDVFRKFVTIDLYVCVYVFLLTDWIQATDSLGFKYVCYLE